MGLATSYGIAKQHGGHIAAYTEVGVGTTMKVYLPRVREEAEAPKQAIPTLPRGNETILLVEDEAAVRDIAARMLQRQGYTVLEASDGEEALRVVEQHRGPVHVLLTAVVLPNMGGRHLAERMEVLRPEIKVLFASGYTDDVILRHNLLKRRGMLVQKPFTAELLAGKVHDALDAEER